MRKIALLPLSLLFLSGWAAAQDPCTALAQPQAQPAGTAAVAAELAAPRQRLGAPSGVLAQAYAEAQPVDTVLQRLRISNCQVAAGKQAPGTKPASTAATTEVIDPATYKPKTEHDNTPWRFDMSQNGKRMTAEEFDAWMKARGVRVAKGAPPKPAEAPAAAPGESPAPQKK